MAIAPLASRDSSSILRLRAFHHGEVRASRGGSVPAQMAEAASKPPIEAARAATALPEDILDRRSAFDLLERRASVDAGRPADGGLDPLADGRAGEAGAAEAGAAESGDAETGAAGSGAAKESDFEGRAESERASGGRDGEARASAKEAERPSERELLDRLAGLEAEKAGGRRKRESGQAARSAAVQQALAALKARDGEVRAHEGAHIAAGGRYVTGGASYSYQKGPDGRQYAVGGEVGIDSAPLAGKPEETAAKMRIVRAAALAPAEPSGADHAVAAAASQAEAAAFAEIAARRREDAAAAYGAERDAASLAAGRKEAEALPAIDGAQRGLEAGLWA